MTVTITLTITNPTSSNPFSFITESTAKTAKNTELINVRMANTKSIGSKFDELTIIL